MAERFQCVCCGAWHDELPLDLAFAEPQYVAELDEDERAQHVKGTGDFRELIQGDATHYFIRGVIEIPIIGSDEVFRYGVWTTLSAKSCEAAKDAYKKNVEAGPFFGWLSNMLPNYPRTLNLKTQVHVRADVRPAIELEPTDHPLAVEQREGITMDRVREIISNVMHASA